MPNTTRRMISSVTAFIRGCVGNARPVGQRVASAVASDAIRSP